VRPLSDVLSSSINFLLRKACINRPFSSGLRFTVFSEKRKQSRSGVRKNEPLVSVIVGAHNAEAFIFEAVESVLKQEYKNFELIVVDDASTDDTLKMLRTFTDSRIKIVSLGQRLGLAGALNYAIDLAKGKYLARFDADDICFPARLKKQVDFMQKNPSVGVLGGAMIAFGQNKPATLIAVDCSRSLEAQILRGNPMMHPTIMFRAQLMGKSGFRYDPAVRNAQDYVLWGEMICHTKFANLPDPLVGYRLHESQETARNRNRQRKVALQVQLRLLMSKKMRQQCTLLEIIQGYYHFFKHFVAYLVHSTYRLAIR
jgi:glycosyltransferase involved in cell wall biosynthesis